MRAAIYQSCTGIDPEANARNMVAAIGEARDRGADMLFTPEMSGLIDRDRARSATHIHAEADEPVLAAVRGAAAAAKLWVHLGSLALKSGRADGRLVNRGFLIDDTGAIRARYDKIHLFDVELASGETWRESAAYAPGDHAVVGNTPWGRIGLSICYDVRFPDLYRALSDAGADILAVPAAFTVPTGLAHWHVLLRARAIEAGAFVIAAAQAGNHEDGRATFGHSLVVDPWGEVLLDMESRIGVGIAELDPARIADVRGRIPALRHRRPIGIPEIMA
jgi:predicted amidohydrolase